MSRLDTALKPVPAIGHFFATPVAVGSSAPHGYSR